MGTIARHKIKRLIIDGDKHINLPNNTHSFSVTSQGDEMLKMAFQAKDKVTYANFKDEYKTYEGDGTGTLFFKGIGEVEIKINIC